MKALTALFVYSFLISFLRTSTTLDTITPSQSIRDGETLVSAGRIFELGFFSPGSSKHRYVGIWFVVSNDTVVWVVNRETPLKNHCGVLKVTNAGILVLLDCTNTTIWSSNTSRTAGNNINNPTAQLLDSGNLVVKDGNNESLLWQSFDHPCDTLLSEMKLGWDLVSGLDRYLTSWNSTEDPAPSEISARLDRRGLPQLVVTKGDKIKVRLGFWNGLNFTGMSWLRPNSLYKYEFVRNEKEIYYEYKVQNNSTFLRYVINPSGIGEGFKWMNHTNSWELGTTTQSNECENYAHCGAYTSCDINKSPVCACLEGFIPKSPKDWNLTDWSGGCVRGTPLGCNDRDGFLTYKSVKLPDTSSSWFDRNMSLKKCEEMCLDNCLCKAYANLDITNGGSGCLLWFADLVDLVVLQMDGQDLYIRVATSILDHIEKKRHLQVIIIVCSATLLMVMLVVGLVTYVRRMKLRNEEMNIRCQNDYNNEGKKEDMELPIFDLTVISNATDNFASSNKLGEGGFGSVYKGTFLGGQEIAVKRLSKNSRQGLIEFKNEVISIAKLQHRNLVKLLGCCIQENEKLLIYEYMHNKSLDSFIFDQTKSKLLDWRMRNNIISGIARGLLYLHEDSILRIIHRDLKASNILLDSNMNPKISDFGLAKIFGMDQIEANTNRIVGTYGYMPPEYAGYGHFSVKTDVFSFGVLVLEIVSGKKNNKRFCNSGQFLNLLGHAWRLWIEDEPTKLIDEFLILDNSCTLSELLRSIHVGLLCVQQRPEDRPNMSSVVLMLSSEISLPEPSQPGFYTEKVPVGEDYSSRALEAPSRNEITFTSLEAR
ncbi:G-type lectin S-receptor-like serine/threonine-protein kinase At4g27290 [Castanea sativa]|uniref:G-type lectin S-receptor-like serine/threonine-protein kinase At4g27290 n=1 Tax=Castanea sativa TaxID=21020 RepID=UPI003F650873